MGYRITYGNQWIKKNLRDKNKIFLFSKWMSVFFACLVLLGAALNTKIRRLLLPGDPEITERALSELVVDLREGEPVSDAVTAFCREILDNA